MLALCAAVLSIAKSQDKNQFDEILKQEFTLNNTGITAIVSSKGKIIYKKALGMANAELNVPMQTDNVFRLGSITKQFTAIAILQLMEQGKLNVQDELTKFIPDYPVKDAKITIENLLTHTSGIRDYTSIRDTAQRSKMDFTPVEMISYFKNQPMRFAPGAKYEYSNSNYFLLGYIIEKITGKTYAQYLEENFFQPLGMSNSSYASDTKIIKNRAAGYTMGKQGIENAAALSMTQPYAAGAVLSTVEDLFKWQQAIQSYKLVKKETLEKAFAKYRLSNGAESNYGYGWRLGSIQESSTIWHGGLINGFMTTALYLPKEDVYVAVLSNCDCFSPENATAKLAAAAIGKPYLDKEIKLEEKTLDLYTGEYKVAPQFSFTVTKQNGKLFVQGTGQEKMEVIAVANNKFLMKASDARFEFVTEGGKVTKVILQQGMRMTEAMKVK